jgi:hypothetical protein
MDSAAVDVGQRSVHVMFADSYLELTAVSPGALPEHLRPYLDRSGLIILALRVDHAATAHQRLLATPLTLTAACRSERPVAYAAPAAQGMAAFCWFMCAATEFPEMLVCFVEHLTPDLVFQPAVCQHDNGASGLARVFLLAADPIQASRRFGSLALTAAGDHREAGLVICNQAAAVARFPGIDFGGARGRAIGVGLTVDDLDRMARRLTRAGVRWQQQGNRIWCAGPAGGVLEFQA